ncbi:Cof-type HAD-IIB family hydrolase [Treponema sp.]|uniref:Cof-type HAD-IIB family hydrolase n=1 Tax=Treponema sp. TaxID=166 RepID=UPI00298EAEDC|nr:Cof-type HAD-IIB family hydrolase [Treponema sp.]
MIKLPQEKLDPKLIALDLDDTLLNKELTISPATVKALQNAASKGIYIVPCSGRAENGILPFVRLLDLAGTQAGRFIIAVNGTTIYDLHLRQNIFTAKVDGDVLIHAFEVAQEYGYPAQVYDSTTTYANEDNEFSRMDAELCHLNLKIVPDFKNYLKTGHTKMLVPGEPETIKIIEQRLKKELAGKAVVFISKPFFLEIIPYNAGKGEAIHWLADHLGIPHEKTMAFGDSMNDESMLRMSGYSVAMCNGLEYIQNVAKYVTRKSNNEDGIADFINEFVL